MTKANEHAPAVNGVPAPPSKPPRKRIARPAQDAFVNMAARLGWGSGNLNEQAQYVLSRFTRNYVEIQAMYRTSWIARRVIDCIAQDMTKNWIELTCQVDPKAIDQFTKVITKTQTRAKLLSALKWGRLFGGAAAIMLIDGHQDELDQPLALDDVGPGMFRGLLVRDRWSGITPAGEVISDINDPDFGLPATYQVQNNDGTAFNVHPSRVLRFIGRDLPNWEAQVEMHWGLSEYELLFPELQKRDNTSWSIASLVFRANIFAMKIKDLAQMMSAGNAKNLERVYAVLQAQSQLMTNQGMLIMPEDGGLETHQYSFGGIDEIYQSFMADICGATEIPMTRLFGRTQTGLGQSNEGDEHIYFDTIRQKQDRELRPQLDKLLPVIAMSIWGEVPEDWDYAFLPLRTLNDKEQADLAGSNSKSILDTFNAGIIGRKTALKELRQQADTTGLFSNITDEMIEDADDDVDKPGELLPGLPGEEEQQQQPGAPDSKVVEMPKAAAAKV